MTNQLGTANTIDDIQLGYSPALGGVGTLVTQAVAEVAWPDAAPVNTVHVTQEAAEVAWAGPAVDSHGRITQEIVEVAWPSPAVNHARVTQTFIEVAWPEGVGAPLPCWESLTQRLIGYLGKPFRHASEGLLWQFLGTVARELSTCLPAVSVSSGEGRGGGTFTFPVTFDPITGVAGVRRVDGTGSVLETYTVVSYDGRQVTVSGVTAPKAGDYLQVDYTYTHEGLLGRVRTALLELNILTATGSFLDSWGSWFGMTRVKTGSYGSIVYGTDTYGTAGLEPDNVFAQRVIDRVVTGRNTPVAILTAIRRLTGGSPYLVSWMDDGGNNAWIFRPSGSMAWAGEADTRKHLIWGRTSRFVDGTAPNGGAFVFEVWVPAGSGYSTATLLSVVNALKPAGAKAYLRYQP